MHRRRHHVLAILLLLSMAVAECVFAHPAPVLSSAPDQASEPSLPLQPGDRNTILAESFEGGWPPSGWAILHEGAATTWQQDGNFPRSGSHCAWMDYGPVGVLEDEYLVTAAIDLTGYGSAWFSFYEGQRYWPGYGEHHYVGVSTTSQTDPGAFVWLVDWTPQNHPMPPSTEQGAPVYTTDPRVINLDAYLGEPVVYVCFRYFGSYADHWFIDDVKVFESFAHDIAVDGVSHDGLHVDAPASIDPEVVVENIGANSETFDLRLTASASGLIVYDQTLSMSLGVAGVDTVSFPPLALSPGHYYQFDAEALLQTDEEPANDTAQSRLDTYTEVHVPLGYLHTNAT